MLLDACIKSIWSDSRTFTEKIERLVLGLFRYQSVNFTGYGNPEEDVYSACQCFGGVAGAAFRRNGAHYWRTESTG